MSGWMREEKRSWMGDNGPMNQAGVCVHLVRGGGGRGGAAEERLMGSERCCCRSDRTRSEDLPERSSFSPVA